MTLKETIDAASRRSNDIEISAVQVMGARYAGLSKNEAVEKFMADFPSWRIVEIDGEEVFCRCEVCGRPLLSDSEYHHDADGVVWCKSHGK